MGSDPLEKDEKEKTGENSSRSGCREAGAESEKDRLEQESIDSPSDEQEDGGKAGASGEGDIEREEERSPTIPPGARVSRTASISSTSRPSVIASVRAAVLAVQRMLVLALLAVVASALLNSLIIGRMMVPAIRERLAVLGDGVLASFAGGFLAQIGLLLFLPALAWALAWVLDERPYRLCLGAALFTELWHYAVLFVTAGLSGIVADPVLLSTRIVFMGLAGFLAGLAYGHGRRFSGRAAS